MFVRLVSDNLSYSVGKTEFYRYVWVELEEEPLLQYLKQINKQKGIPFFELKDKLGDTPTLAEIEVEAEVKKTKNKGGK